MVTRREALLGIAAWCSAPLLAARTVNANAGARLLAAWSTAEGPHVGMLDLDDHRGAASRIVAALALPTRAHSIVVEPSGSILVVARRPGDWVLRLHLGARGIAGTPAWQWVEPQRAFSGHVRCSADGATLFTTETDLDTGVGLIGVRDAATMQKRDEWPTHGVDPHDLLLADDGIGPVLWVANGGVVTYPETGRVKHASARMDSSLVRLDARTGAPTGQWRVDDPHLSLRHLAQAGSTVAIALQAEHPAPAMRVDAPLLAVWSGDTLHTAAAPMPLQGYGGDIAATADGLIVSSPRGGGIARYTPSGQWRDFVALDDACALARDGATLWVGGGDRVQRIGTLTLVRLPGTDLRLDNHATIWRRGGKA